jgi:hypothetical protein
MDCSKNKTQQQNVLNDVQIWNKIINNEANERNRIIDKTNRNRKACGKV